MQSAIGDDEPVSTAVLRAVSAVDGRKPGALDPLSDVIDPGALDALFGPRPDGGSRAGKRLSFTYSSCQVTVDDGDVLTIEPVEPRERPSARSDGTDRTERTHQRDTQQTATDETPASRVCVVCQQPIERANLQRELGELVHDRCRAELRCGISLETWSER